MSRWLHVWFSVPLISFVSIPHHARWNGWLWMDARRLLCSECELPRLKGRSPGRARMRRGSGNGTSIQMREGVCRCHRDLWGEWILLAEAWAPLWPRWAKATARARKSKSIIAQGSCQGSFAHSVSTPLPGSHPMAHVPWTSVQPKEPKDDMSFVTSFDSLMPSAPRQSSLFSYLLYCTYVHTSVS